VFNSVVYKGEWARISKRGGEAVYLVSEDDIRLLEEIEDRRLAELGEEALEKHRRTGGETVSWEELKGEAVTR
jgi:PHD/YefM family antitoxin component YafN of YafNO toxin-antitoxin module